jgi:hypothetical protein
MDGWSSRRKDSANCPGWLWWWWWWWWWSWWNELFWQGKPKYSEKSYPDATLSTTNTTCQTQARTRAAAVGSQRLTASAMARPSKQTYPGLFWVGNRLILSLVFLCIGRCRSSSQGVLSSGQRTCNFRVNFESHEARWINPWNLKK